MYCCNCGKEIPEGGRFCPECGCIVANSSAEPVAPSARTDAVDPEMTFKKRSEITALLLSLFVTGLGHIYIGKTDRGIALLLAQILFAMFSIVYLFPFIVCVILWFYGMYDSYSLAKKYNAYMMSHDGRTPW